MFTSGVHSLTPKDLPSAGSVQMSHTHFTRRRGLFRLIPPTGHVAHQRAQFGSAIGELFPLVCSEFASERTVEHRQPVIEGGKQQVELRIGRLRRTLFGVR